MRIPEFETLKAKGCPQKVHWPVVIGFLERLCLPFTKSFLATMVRIRPHNSRNRTVSKPKIVAPRSGKSRFIRQALAAVLRFVRKKRYLPDVEGDLSAWICAAHGFTEKESGDEESGAEDLDPNKQKDLIEASAEFTNKWFGPGMDAQRAERSITRTREIIDTRVQRIAREYRSGNLKRYETLISEATAEMLKELRTPRGLFQPHGLSIEQFARFRRATRATLICLALHNEHPLVLIARAAKGDRVAVLSLVKTDKLFLHDRCCAPTIRNAELRDDHTFIMQLKRAMEYEPTLRSRDALRVYYYILLLLESWGFPLPTLNELWSTLDPRGKEYESLSAFEKDFQRRRRDFIRMFREADEEVPRMV